MIFTWEGSLVDSSLVIRIRHPLGMSLGDILGWLIISIWTISWFCPWIGTCQLLWHLNWFPTFFFSLHVTCHNYFHTDQTFTWKFSGYVSWGIGNWVGCFAGVLLVFPIGLLFSMLLGNIFGPGYCLSWYWYHLLRFSLTPKWSGIGFPAAPLWTCTRFDPDAMMLVWGVGISCAPLYGIIIKSNTKSVMYCQLLELLSLDI